MIHANEGDRCWAGLVAAVCLLLAGAGSAAARSWELKADLDGDGKKERVACADRGADGGVESVTVSVGGKSVTCTAEMAFDESAVRAVSPWGDGARQLLAVEFIGPNDSQEIHLVGRARAGAALAELDKISVWGGLEFPGNGACVATVWQGFWSKIDKLLLKKDGSLQRVPQPFYSVGLKAKTKEAFPIFQERGKPDKVATIAAGSEIRIVLCAPVADSGEGDPMDNDFYLVRSVTGYLGWVRFSDVRRRLELPWAG